jgi:hypothetical protein
VHSPNRANDRKLRPEYRTLIANQQHRQRPQQKSGWLRRMGRVLRDYAALIAALLALVGVIFTQIVTANSAQDLEEARAREAELQTYFNDMGEMLLDENRPLPDAEPSGPLSSLARAKTLTILERLDGQRKGIVLLFLRESQLILAERSVVDLRGANLSDGDLSDEDLREADLFRADLRYADLSAANLSAANLREADLFRADLRYANLRDANLRDAIVTTEELEAEAPNLSGTIMPDGSVHD